MTDLLLTLLAEEPNRGPDYGKASPIGLLVVVLLLIGLFVLLRSMNRHLKKVPTSFDSTSASASAAPPPAVPDTVADTAPETMVPPRESGG